MIQWRRLQSLARAVKYAVGSFSDSKQRTVPITQDKTHGALRVAIQLMVLCAGAQMITPR